MKRHEKLAEAEKKLAQAERELAENKDISDSLLKRRHELCRDIASLKNTIAQLQPVQLTVTDHAVLRYLERYYSIDIPGIRNEIHERLQGLEDLAKEEVQTEGFVLKGGSVLTYKGGPREETA